MLAISEFKIYKLYGQSDIALKIKDNVLILVGENGSGKTTILRIMYLFLSGRWLALLKYDFENISVSFADKSKVSLSKKNLSTLLKKSMENREFLRSIPSAMRHRYYDLIEEGDELMDMHGRYKYSRDYPFDKFSSDSVLPIQSEDFCKLREVMHETTILYLPTYRRIEKELSAIFRGIDEDELRNKSFFRHLDLSCSDTNSYEIIEFGMRDIKSSIERMSMVLNQFVVEELNRLTLHYLSDVVEQKYKKVNIKLIKDASHESIHNTLERIDKTILSQSSLEKLSDTINAIHSRNSTKKTLNEHERVICHYFTKLLDFQRELDKREEQIRKFCELCNAYIVNKQFYYDSSSFKVFVRYGNEQVDSLEDLEASFDLENLSSGEKQIVSLFSHLYLVPNRKFFIMIDEPELSLSVPWQRKFLVDMHNASSCAGLIAVTHSPFIFQNELDPYVHGLGEFMMEN